MDPKKMQDEDNIPSTSNCNRKNNAKRATKHELDAVINSVFDNATTSSLSDSDEENELQSDKHRMSRVQIVGKHCLRIGEGNIGRPEAQKSIIINKSQAPVDNQPPKTSKQQEHKILSKHRLVKAKENIRRTEAPELKIEIVRDDPINHMFPQSPKRQGYKVVSKHRPMRGGRMYRTEAQKSKTRSLSKLYEGQIEEKMMQNAESKSLSKLSEDAAMQHRLNHNVSQLLAVFDLTKSDSDASKQKIFEQCGESSRPRRANKVERVFLPQIRTDVDRHVPAIPEPRVEIFDESYTLPDTISDSAASSAHTVVGVVTGEPPSMQMLQLRGYDIGDTETDTTSPRVSDFLMKMNKSFEHTSSQGPPDSAPKKDSREKVVKTRKEEDKLEQKKSVRGPQNDARFLAEDKIDAIKREHNNARLSRLETRHADEQNKEIAERFKQIMQMFDNFTKNLQSIETPLNLSRTMDEPRPSHCSPRSSSPFDSPIDLCPRVHRSRYDCYVQDVIKRANESTQAAANKKQQHRQSRRPPPPVEEIFPLEHTCYKEIATSVSGMYLRDEHEPTERDLSVLSSPATTDTYNIPGSSPSETPALSVVRTVVINSQPTLHDSSPHGTLDDIAETSNQNRITDSATFTVLSEMQSSPLKRLNSVGSGLTLAKVSAPASRMDMSPIMHAPSERTYHTIHIEATSSPSSSMLRRPPLCTRLWNVLTDFCAAICLCLQVNKDCIFCLGFFVAFVVSASFLTAFFYRTLSISPQVYHQQPKQVVLEPAKLPPTEDGGNMFYL